MDRTIGRLASRSHGVVTRAQLLSAGVTAGAIKRRCARGSLIAVYRGVYRVGHIASSVEAAYLAAVLACGPGAWLAGRAALHLLGLLAGMPPSPRVWAPSARRVPGVTLRRYRRRPLALETTRFRGVPTTSPARTLLDVASTVPVDALALAFHEARIKHRTTERQVLRVLELHPTAPGRRDLRAVILGDVPVTLNRFEARFRAVISAAGLPLPDESNCRIDSGYVDCRYHDPPMTIELDSYTSHASRHQWEVDRRRERAAYARGDQHRRYTYGDVFEDSRAMLAELRDLLAHRIHPT